MADNEQINQQVEKQVEKKAKSHMSDKTRYILLGVAGVVCVAAIILACVFLTGK